LLLLLLLVATAAAAAAAAVFLRLLLMLSFCSRMKDDVEKALPPREETMMEVELTSIQKQYYKVQHLACGAY
jgi:hypothetical protein